MPVRTTFMPYTAFFYGIFGGREAQFTSVSVFPPAADRSAGNSAMLSRSSKPPTTLPEGVKVFRVELMADTSAVPRGATGIKCAGTTSYDVGQTWANANTGAAMCAVPLAYQWRVCR